MKAALLVVAALIVAAVTAVVLNFVGVFAFRSADGRQVAADISASLSNSTGTRVSVSCPREIPMRKGGIEDCQANAGNGTTIVRVVQDDSRGHFHFTINEPGVLSAPEPTAEPAAPVQRDDEPCPAATPSLLGAIEARPKPDVLALDLQNAVEAEVGGVRYVIAVADIRLDDGAHGRISAVWAVEGGRISTYDDGAAGVTSWPRQQQEGLTSATSMTIEYCRERLSEDP